MEGLVTPDSWIRPRPQWVNGQFNGGQQDVVLLGSGGRIGDIDVPKSVLPAQPFADLGHRGEVKRPAVLTGVVQIRKDIKLFGQHGVHADLLSQLLAH